MKILFIIGTRPEGIKLAPVIRAFQRSPWAQVLTCSTGQHREMLSHILEAFGICPDFELGVMDRAHGLSGIAAEVLSGLDAVLEASRPDWVFVHGDTTSALAAALAAFHRQIPVAHVEAGLRTYDLDAPFPEEMNRQVIARVATVHFAPTHRARANLLRDGVPPDSIVVTGNTVIDALRSTVAGPLAAMSDPPAAVARVAALDPSQRVVLLTGHRRENQSGGLKKVFRAMRRVMTERDVKVAFPVHQSPAVRKSAESVFHGQSGVLLLPPVDYVSMVWLMRRSHFIVTDSGGIQEEAPSLGKPVLVTRAATERPEAVEAGMAMLVGTSEAAIYRESLRLLDDDAHYRRVASIGSPFGDGFAAERICERLLGRGIAAA